MAALPSDQWLTAAQQWTDWDLNIETRTQIQQLVNSKNVKRLQELFSRRVTFGTAGLRAVMGPGPSAMNDLVVIQTSQGLCTYLVKQLGEQAKIMGVALGYDHRQRSLSSKRFAELTASVCLHCGFRVYLYEDVVATPLVVRVCCNRTAVGGV